MDGDLPFGGRAATIGNWWIWTNWRLFLPQSGDIDNMNYQALGIGGMGCSEENTDDVR